MRARILGVGILCAMAFALGCASLDATLDPLGRRSDLEDQQRKYTQLIRWGELDAASSFVADDSRESFQKVTAQLAGMRFTDHEQTDLDWAEDGKSVDVRVTYRGYRVSTLVDRPLVEKQHWFRDEEAGAWRVQSDWSELQASLGPAR